MKKKLLSTIGGGLIIILLLSACNNGKKKTTIDCSVKIKDIVMTNKTDTISYALGVVWGIGLARNVGINKISNTFYIGVQDYINGDTALMGIYKANDYLEKHQSEIKNDPSWPENDTNIRLCDIQLKSKWDTISYALGFAWCRGAYGIGISKVSPSLVTGISKGIKSDTSVFSFRSADKYLREYIEGLRLVKFADIKKKNDQWIVDNKNNPDVITLENGLQYKIIKSGNGKSVAVNDIVECNYIFKLIDGAVIENTYKTQETRKFYPFAVCKGLSQAVQLMKEGDKWEVYIPYSLAYGSGGIKDQVPPFATVIYEIDLIKVTKNN
jgi:FKBP-type peptidyl-prolyl cis-trans isomerase FklB